MRFAPNPFYVNPGRPRTRQEWNGGAEMVGSKFILFFFFLPFLVRENKLQAEVANGGDGNVNKTAKRFARAPAPAAAP